VCLSENHQQVLDVGQEFQRRVFPFLESLVEVKNCDFF